MIDSILSIVKSFMDMLNRESSSDEKIKDHSIKLTKDEKKAINYAKQIFDGNEKFKGLDVILPDKLDAKEYKYYIDLRHKFNKYS
jgi:hypothetical protein